MCSNECYKNISQEQPQVENLLRDRVKRLRKTVPLSLRDFETGEASPSEHD